jgi:asparagine synthase (glutamine-hydrolysing)
LREAFKQIIPESTRNRKKLGFPTPIKNWLNKDRTDVYDTILKNDYIKTHMDIDYISDLIDKHNTKKVDNSRKIYILLMLSLWYDVFVSSKSKKIK